MSDNVRRSLENEAMGRSFEDSLDSVLDIKNELELEGDDLSKLLLHDELELLYRNLKLHLPKMEDRLRWLNSKHAAFHGYTPLQYMHCGEMQLKLVRKYLEHGDSIW